MSGAAGRIRESDREWLEPDGADGARRSRVVGEEPDVAVPAAAGGKDWERSVPGSWDGCACGGTGRLVVNAGEVVPCPAHGTSP